MSRNLKCSEWSEYICLDLQPVIEWLGAQHRIQIVKAVFDMKGAYTYLYVDGPLPERVRTEAQIRFSSNSNLRFGEGWIGCAPDFVSIEVSETSGAGEPKKTSFRDWLRDMLRI